jgi:phospholipid-binding lipoprotein MlaA
MKICPDHECRRPRHIATGALIAVLVAIAGCSSTPPADRSDARDRSEDTNRKVFAFNMGVDTYVLEPVASGYRNTVPESGRTAIDNHLRWASMPSTAINSTLQGKFENAALATLNFLVNGLTLGFADLSEDDQKVDREDFGQTLAAYDVPEGSYLMVPVLGPRTTRSLTGTVVDMVMNPLQIFGTTSTADTVRTAQAPVGAVSFRAKTFEAFNDVKYNSLDPYARTRSVYYQTRLGLLEDRVAESAGSAVSEDEFDSLFEESE